MPLVWLFVPDRPANVGLMPKLEGTALLLLFSLASIGFLALCALRIRSMLARNSTPFRLDLIGTPTNSTIVVASLVLLLAVVPVVIYAVYSFVNFIAS